MAIANGFNHFLSWKAQTAFGTKASGLAKTMVPIRSGQIFDPQTFRRPRQTVVQAIPKVANLYNISKILPWRCELELINPRTANDTVRDFLRATFGKEVITTGSPFTKKYTINDPLVDGGTDTATDFYGRALTLHEQADNSAGTAIFAHEVQDAVVDRAEFVFEPDAVTRILLTGRCSDLQDDQTDISPSDPTGGVHTWEHLKNTANSGLRIGTANPPTTSDNVVYSRATLRVNNSTRYAPWLGESATKQARLPVRGDICDIELEIVLDVEDSIASQYDTKDMVDHWVASTSVNIDFLSYIGVNEIFEFKASAATAAAIVDRWGFTTPGPGPMQATVVFKVYPASLADAFIQLTTVDV